MIVFCVHCSTLGLEWVVRGWGKENEIRIYWMVAQELYFLPELISYLKALPGLAWWSNDKESTCGSAGKESACNAGDLGLIPGWEDPLEKETATHSSILAQRISWTAESVGSQRVGQDWETFSSHPEMQGRQGRSLVTEPNSHPPQGN